MKILLIIILATTFSSCTHHKYKSYDSGYRAGKIDQWKQDHKHLKPTYKRK